MDLQYHVYDDQNFLTSTWAIINPRAMSIAPYGRACLLPTSARKAANKYRKIYRIMYGFFIQFFLYFSETVAYFAFV